jgi:hypothetical protein
MYCILYTHSICSLSGTKKTKRSVADARGGFVPKVQVAWQRLKDAPAPPQSHGPRLEFVKGTSPHRLPCHCTDKSGNTYFFSL